MGNLQIAQNKEIVYGELMKDEFQKLDYINKQFSIVQSDFHQNIRQYDRNVDYLESINYKYWNTQYEYSNIENNEFQKYINLKKRQD